MRRKPPKNAGKVDDALSTIEMRQPKDISDDEIIAALSATAGKIGLACKMLGINYQALHRRIKWTPRIQEELDTIREVALDATEMALEEQIAEGNVLAIGMKLRAQGKARGYADEMTPESQGRSGARDALKGVFGAISHEALREVIRALESQELADDPHTD